LAGQKERRIGLQRTQEIVWIVVAIDFILA